MRSLTAAGVLGLVLCTLGQAGATELTCRKRAGAKTGALYLITAKEFDRCSRSLAAGDTCNTATRDAKVQTKLGRARLSVANACDAFVAATLGFPSSAELALRVAGAAAGEGRQLADGVYGRDPLPRSASEITCASSIAFESAKAGKKQVKTLIPCGSACGPAQQAVVDAAFATATTAIGHRCGPAELAALVGGDLAGHLADVRAGAQRVVAAMSPGPKPVVSAVVPTPGAVITPPGLPASVDVVARVTQVPHAGYVNSVRVNGQNADYDTPTGDFDHTLLVASPGGSSFPIFLEARTTLGTVAGSTNVRFNLGTLAPNVVITSPASGTITGASSVTIGGQVIGDLAEADVLLVGGALTSFNPVSGAFSTSVPLGAGSVHIIEASVQSLTLGTTNRDSVVVLKGAALSLGTRVPQANFNRLNNSGFQDVRGVIQSMLEPAFAPANFIGQSAGGGTISGFSTGTKTANVFGAGANTVTTTISINNFHLSVTDVGPFGACDAVYDASNATITAQVNLVGQLQVSINTSDVIFTGGQAELTGGILCDFVDLFLSDLEGDMEGELSTEFTARLPQAFNDALAGINVSGPIGAALDVNIDAVYSNIPEDSQGVTFIVDSNMIPLSPIPDAPPITQTLLPTAVGPPVLGPTIPSTATPYDLGFCLSDGFVNRAMAAFMLQGRFNQSLTEVPVGGTNVPLSTPVVSFLMGDPSYQTACPGCPVTLVLRPTAAAVARAPQPGETASVVLTIPNYRVDVVATNGSTPQLLIAGNVTFDLPVTLDVSGSEIAPVVGTLSVANVKVTDNPIGASTVAFADKVADLFPLAAQALGGLFGEIPLPEFQGLTLTGVGSGYNTSCTAIYLNLSP